MKSIITILIASIGILGAQTKTVGPSGEGITSGTRSAFLDTLGGSAAGKALFTAADAAAQRTAMGLGTAATQTGTYYTINGTGIDASGATDSTTAIHAIMDAAVTAGVGNIYFPAGTYKCNLVINSARKHLVIFGAGCGSLDDWSGSSTPATTLKPNDNALPSIKYEALGSTRLYNLEIEGNGAGTSALGIAFEGSTPGTYIGGGFLAENVVVRKFTRNGYSDGGGQITFRNCGIFQGNYGFDISDSVFAHTYEFDGVAVGGTPATGAGRCYEVKGSNVVIIRNGEHGNCTDFLYQAGTQAPRVDVFGGNWETFSASKIIEVTRGTFNQTGGRLSLVAGAAYLRANPATSYSDRYRGLYGILLIGVRAPGIKEADGSYGAYACTLYQHNGEFPYPTIKQAGTSAFSEEWNSDFTSMVSRELVGDNDPLDARSGPLLASGVSDLTDSIEWETFVNFPKIRPSIRQVYTSASGGGAANFDQGSFIYTSTTAGSYGKAVLATTITTYSAWTGAAVPSATPAFAYVWGTMKTIPTDDTSRVRIIIGDSVATPVSSDTQPIAANGYGAEIYYDTGSSSVKVRAFAYNGTYSESAGVSFPVTYGKNYNLLVGQDGAGNVKIYGAVSTGAGDIVEPSLIITHPGCPTTGFLSSNSISVIATSKSSGTCAATECFVHRAATGVLPL